MSLKNNIDHINYKNKSKIINNIVFTLYLPYGVLQFILWNGTSMIGIPFK